jgi:hypothetical protein
MDKQEEVKQTLQVHIYLFNRACYFWHFIICEVLAAFALCGKRKGMSRHGYIHINMKLLTTWDVVIIYGSFSSFFGCFWNYDRR